MRGRQFSDRPSYVRFVRFVWFVLEIGKIGIYEQQIAMLVGKGCVPTVGCSVGYAIFRPKVNK